MTEQEEADTMFEDFDAENTEEGDADVDWARAKEQTPGYTNVLIAENKHYRELAEWLESMSVVEFALWKLLSALHPY